MNSLKFYIDKLKDCDAHEVINSLRVNPVLSVEEKNLIYLYLFLTYYPKYLNPSYIHH